MDNPPATSRPQKTPFLINRNYARLWTGQTISTLGDMVFDTTLVLWIAISIAPNQPWAPLAISGVLIAAALPTLLIGPIAGVFTDHWDKRKTMLRMDALRAVLIVLLLVALPLPFLPGGLFPVAVQLGMIYGVVMLTSTCSQFFSPAHMSKEAVAV